MDADTMTARMALPGLENSWARVYGARACAGPSRLAYPA